MVGTAGVAAAWTTGENSRGSTSSREVLISEW